MSRRRSHNCRLRSQKEREQSDLALSKVEPVAAAISDLLDWRHICTRLRFKRASFRSTQASSAKISTLSLSKFRGSCARENSQAAARLSIPTRYRTPSLQ